MSYTLTVDPEVRRGAEAYAARKGMTLDGVINAYQALLAKQASRRRSAVELIGCCRDSEYRSTAEIMKELREGEES